MTHTGHRIEQCECGIIIMQCRCMDVNKPVITVTPCTHKPEEKAEGKMEQAVETTLDFYHVERTVPDVTLARFLTQQLNKLGYAVVPQQTDDDLGLDTKLDIKQWLWCETCRVEVHGGLRRNDHLAPDHVVVSYPR